MIEDCSYSITYHHMRRLKRIMFYSSLLPPSPSILLPPSFSHYFFPLLPFGFLLCLSLLYRYRPRMRSMFIVPPPAVGVTFDGVNPRDYTRIAKEIQLNLMANSIQLTELSLANNAPTFKEAMSKMAKAQETISYKDDEEKLKAYETGIFIELLFIVLLGDSFLCFGHLTHGFLEGGGIKLAGLSLV
jgi:hypothetical protein